MLAQKLTPPWVVGPAGVTDFSQPLGENRGIGTDTPFRVHRAQVMTHVSAAAQSIDHRLDIPWSL